MSDTELQKKRVQKGGRKPKTELKKSIQKVQMRVAYEAREKER
jgi:hypothetical protein